MKACRTWARTASVTASSSSALAWADRPTRPLYFAQARETANLREQAYEAAQRVAQLEARLTSLARQQVAAAQVAPARAAQAGGVRSPARPWSPR